MKIDLDAKIILSKYNYMTIVVRFTKPVFFLADSKFARSLYVDRKNIVNQKIADMLNVLKAYFAIDYVNSLIIYEDGVSITLSEIYNDNIVAIIKATTERILEVLRPVAADKNMVRMDEIYALLSPYNSGLSDMAIEGYIMSAVQKNFGDVMNDHGGLIKIYQIDKARKEVTIKFYGACSGCRFRDSIIATIVSVLRELGDGYKVIESKN